MARNTNYAPLGANPDQAKEEFGEKLRHYMNQRGWNQSDLAREADLRRDAISTYVRGKVWPDPSNLRKLSDALRVTPGDLIKGMSDVPSSSPSRQTTPQVEIQQTGENEIFLRINRSVSLEQAAQILAILKAR
jgi:transcriptional regulator with XRE-family HTH domain